MSEDTSKFKEWYEEHSDAWNKQRRGRYSEDPEYRKVVLERNRRSRAAAREVRILEQKEALKHKITGDGQRGKKVTVVIDGRPVTLFTIGYVAGRLHVSVQAIRLWENNGTLPPPSNGGYRDGQERLYSMEDIERSRTILLATGRLEEVQDKGDAEEEEKRSPFDGLRRKVLYNDGRLREEKLYTVGMLSKEVGRTVVTLQHLERRGDLPSTPLRSSSVGRRLYTRVMVEVVRKAFAARPGLIRGRAAWESFKAEVEAGWQKAGVLTETLGPAVTLAPGKATH